MRALVAAAASLLWLAAAKDGRIVGRKADELVRAVSRGRAGRLSARPEDNRIVGGEDADITEFPYLSSLQMRYTGHLCVANIITFSWLLSAAHCVVGKVQRLPTDYIVVAGCTVLTREAEEQEGQRGWPNLFVVHPLFVGQGAFAYDLAMIRLQSPLKENRRVATVPLPAAVVSVRELRHSTCTVAGWGDTGKKDPTGRAPATARRLMKVELKMVETRNCAMQLGSSLEEHTHFCTYTKDKDACHGDSGSALICDDVQVGVVSWGVGCAADYPGVYSRVDMQMPWLLQVIAAAPPPPRAPAAALCAACCLAALALLPA